MLEHHKETKAEVTLAVLPIPPDEVKQFGVVEVASSGEVLGFQEKPASTTFRSFANPNAWMRQWASTFSTPKCS